MNERDNVKLDLLDRIDEEIIDRNTAKRARLMGRRVAGRRLLLIAVAAALAVCLLGGGAIGLLVSRKQAPVYLGMSVSGAPESVATLTPDRLTLSNTVMPIGNGNDNNGNGNAYGVVGKKYNDDKPNLDGVEKPGTLEVVGGEELYYARPNEDVYITVHLSNPDNYVIQSFTLNGKTYANYMFEDGSDMENLILKYPIGDVEGLLRCTLDEILYIDDSDEIKRVSLEDTDRTVDIGIYTENQPTASVENAVIGLDKITFDVTVTDEKSLIALTGGYLRAVLIRGDEVVAEQSILLGQNSVTFENLLPDTEYTYAVVASYDPFDGEGFAPHLLLAETVRTRSAFAFDSVAPDYTTLAFGLVWDAEHPTKTLDSLALYKGEEKVADLALDATSVDGLLTDTEYRLVATYTHKGESETVEQSFRTRARAVPTVMLTAAAEGFDKINGSYTYTDTDGVLLSHRIELYLGETVVATGENMILSAASLENYTEYNVKVSYTYDLGDGAGEQTKTAEQTVRTYPFIDVSKLSIANTSAVFVGDTVYLSADISNPRGAKVERVKVNGVDCAVTANSTATRIYVEYLVGDDLGGDTAFSIESLQVKLDGVSYDCVPPTSKSASIFVNGKLEVTAVAFVNESFEEIDWCFSGDLHYLMLKLSNPTGYRLDSLTFIDEYGNEVTTATSFGYIDDNTWYCRDFVCGLEVYRLKRLGYSSQYGSSYVELDAFETIHVVSDRTPIYISTPEDLLNMSGDRYYVLKNDIDLSGYPSWTGGEMVGVFNGNGHTIKNMSFVGTVSPASSQRNIRLGLFQSCTGVVYDLNIDGVNFMVDTQKAHSDVFNYGTLCGELWGTVRNCQVGESSFVKITINPSDDMYYRSSFVGGIVGRFDGKVIDCVNRARIVSNSQYSAGIAAGLIGINSYRYGYIEGCENHGDISGALVAGIAYEATVLTDCVNYGKITCTTGNHNVFGIACSVSKTLSGCINKGDISGGYCAYGIAGRVSGTLSGSVNYGKITAREDAMGIGIARVLSDCINNGDVSVSSDSISWDVCGIGDATTILNCTNNGNISGRSYVAGITVTLYSGKTVKNCVNNGSISSIITGTGFSGGIYCSKESGAVEENCVNNGKVNGK